VRAVPERPSSNPRITVVVPARNEARNLELVLPTLPSDAEIIVVDGHSVDDTAAVVARVRPDARFLQQTRKGKGNALAVGFAAATGDIIVMFDADGSADPLEIDRYVAALLAGADFAKGSRVLAGGGSVDITPIRDLGNKGLTLATNIAFRTKYTDLCYGYNAFWRDVLPELDLPRAEPISATMQWGDGFEIETLINCRVAVAKLDVAEVPSVELERVFGESNLHAVKDGLRVLKTLITERRRAWGQAARLRRAASRRIGFSPATASALPAVQLPAQAAVGVTSRSARSVEFPQEASA
jgi:glycosyltransferase involved in cell wall biosynthesis